MSGELDANEYEVVCALGDGNCFFRSVYKGLKDLELLQDDDEKEDEDKGHGVLRKKAIEYIEKNKDNYIDGEPVTWNEFVEEENFGAYIERMKRDGEWGGAPEAKALGILYRRPINIYMKDGNKYIIIEENQNAVDPIRILWSGNHYDYLRPKNQGSLTLPQQPLSLSSQQPLSLSSQQPLSLSSQQLEHEKLLKQKPIKIPNFPKSLSYSKLINLVNTISSRGTTPLIGEFNEVLNKILEILINIENIYKNNAKMIQGSKFGVRRRSYVRKNRKSISHRMKNKRRSIKRRIGNK